MTMEPRHYGPINQMRFQNLTAQLEARFGDNSRVIGPNHWVFEVMTDDQRSQVVHLLFKEQSADGRDVSRVVVMSPIGEVPQRLDGERLLRMNAKLDVGAIGIEDFRNEENDVVTYLTLRASHLMATMDCEEAWELIEQVGRVADRLEQDHYARVLH